MSKTVAQMQSEVAKMEQLLKQVEQKLEHGGDFMQLFDQKKKLTDNIRNLKLEIQVDQANVQRCESEMAIVNEDDDEDGSEEVNGSIDIDNM